MNLLMLVVGLFGFVLALKLLQISWRVQKGVKQSTYSKNVNRAVIESGIYIEHGMVNDNNDENVRAEYKLSNSYFESMH